MFVNKILYFILSWCLTAPVVLAQVAGTSTYQFLSLQPNARIAAMGGTAITLDDNDMNLALQNPSMLKAEMNNQITYNHVFLFQNIGAGYVGFTKHMDSIGTFSMGIQYIGYGDFKRTLANGEEIGTFSAGEYAANIGYGKKLSDYLSIGGQVKLIYSSLAEFASVGIATDVAATYHNNDKLFTAAAVISNVGRQIRAYNNGNNENLPFNAQLAFSKKFKHNPFRFTIVANHLEKAGKLLYANNEKPGLKKSLETGDIIPETYNIGEKTLAHLTFGSEILLGKTFYIALAYNHFKRREMRLEDLGGFAGFSWGFGFKVSKMQVAYGNTGYYIGQCTNHFSFIFNLNDFKKKKRNTAS